MLIVGRAVAGMGGSGIINGALTIISACVPLVKRPVYLGFVISFAQIGKAYLSVISPRVAKIVLEYALLLSFSIVAF